MTRLPKTWRLWLGAGLIVLAWTGGVANAACVTGTWVAPAVDPNDTDDLNLPIQVQSTHFALRFADGVTTVDAATAAVNYLETVWSRYITTIGFPEPSCHETTKYKVTAFVRADVGLSGGADSLGHPIFYIGPSSFQDHWGMGHEFTHALQLQTPGMPTSPYSYAFHESHAQFMTSQMPDHRTDTNCFGLLRQVPHEYYMSSRNMYCTVQFWEYIKERYGYKPINDIWAKPGAVTDDPFTLLMNNLGWTLTQLNDAFGNWALRNVNWDYIDPDGFDRGAAYRANFGGPYVQTDGMFVRAATRLEPINLSARQFHVADYGAPQRWGYNIVKLYPDAGRTSVTVTFRGVTQSAPAVTKLAGLANEPATIPEPGSDWRWGLVAIDAAGQSRYSSLQSGADGRLTFAVNASDQALYMVVTATPSVMQKIGMDQPFYSIYRYPWMVQFTGAMPDTYQPNAPDIIPGGHRHSNGGGWVGPSAKVASTAYVGPYARVISGKVGGKARIDDQAVISDNAQILGRAVINGLSVVRNNTVVKDKAAVKTNFLGLGDFENNIVLSGTAQNIGDVEQRGTSLTHGVFYGLTTGDMMNDPAFGAALTVPVPEITAKPNFSWRP